MKKLLRTISDIFAREKIDWLDEQPYIGTYFIYKLKRAFMGIFYKIWQKIEDSMLEKYFAEINFNNNLKGQDRAEAYMPFIILSKNRQEAADVLGQINKSLIKDFEFQVTESKLSKQPINDIMYEQEIEKLRNSAAAKKIGKISFNSFVGKKKENIQLNYLPDSYKENTNIGDYENSVTKIDFQIIKDTKHHLLQNSAYIIQITIGE